MPQYVIVYLGGDQPLVLLIRLRTHTVNSDGTVTTGGTTTMSGYTIVAANSMDAALLIAKACPFLEIGGSLEVAELMEMPGRK